MSSECEADSTSCTAFPLTPALSLGERENRFQSVGMIEAFGLAEGLDAGLPLPKGEGRGEGKGRFPMIQGVRV